ncbi:MAG: DUF975 family protein [Bacillus sp. (in: firmicutes)]
MRARDHKLAAKAALKNKWGIAIGVFFIQFIISSFVGGIPEDYAWASVLLFIFLTAPLSVGYSWFYLDVKRLAKPKIETLFEGFSKNYIRNVLAVVFMTIFVILWSLLLIIPGIIKGLSYSMTLYILRDRPELSALEAITESRKMMDGKKKDLFFLMLSFIGWVIIPIAIFLFGLITMVLGLFGDGSVALMITGTLSFFIGLVAMFGISIYVTPYYMTSMAVFYDDYAKPKDDEPTEDCVVDSAESETPQV